MDGAEMSMLELPDREVAAKGGEDTDPIGLATYRYPTELACDVVTLEATKLHLRPIRPDDASRLVDFHQHLSPRSVYRRFFYSHSALPDNEVERFTCVDYVDRLALIAEDGHHLVAIARYDRSPGTSEAEVAFVVADKYQHHGIGTLLLEHLADAAIRNGIATFTAQTLLENRDMIRVFMDSGFSVTTSLDHGIVAIRFSIVPDDASRAAWASRHGRAEDRLANPSNPPPC
jgi:GNAT superfamily N-acetyltransferase